MTAALLLLALAAQPLDEARALLFSHHYIQAAAIFRRVLRDAPNNAEARKGLATAEYWSGDFRSAQRDFAAVLRARPSDAEARRALEEIASASRPVITSDSELTDDDQPLGRARASVAGTFYSDPLTAWTATAGTYAFRGADTSPFASVAGSTWVPSPRLRLGASLRLRRFPDGEAKPLAGVSIAREWRRSSLRLDVDQHELLYTISSLNSHPSETVTTLVWNRNTDATTSAAAVHAIRYFDHNSGRAADAYHLVRLGRLPWSLGAAASYRDTDQSRFNGALYDPYWTPLNQREVRGIAAAAFGRVRLHLDAGVARDDVNGSFHPWRASAAVALPFGATLTVERQSTVFYRATSFRLTIVRRVE